MSMMNSNPAAFLAKDCIGGDSPLQQPVVSETPYAPDAGGSAQACEKGVPFVLVDSQDALDALCAVLGQGPYITLDTEFIRTRTFFPALGLIQVAAPCCPCGKRAYLIDPLAINDLSPFTALLGNRNIVKVFHSCSEDLETLYYLCGFVPGPVFDTQLAATILGHGMQPSLRTLAANMLGVELGKDETRSNWIKRPLSMAQAEYAAQDVLHLPQLYAQLSAGLMQQQRELWAAEEFAALEDPVRYRMTAETSYERFGSLWEWSRRELALLQRICAVREREAMSRDLPRGFILTDRTIRELIRLKPASPKELAKVEGLKPGEIRRSGRAILEAIAQALALDDQELPARVPRPLHSRRLGQVVADARLLVETRSKELGLPPEFLARKRIVTDVVRHVATGGKEPMPNELNGWRRHQVGDALLELITGNMAKQPDEA